MPSTIPSDAADHGGERQEGEQEQRTDIEVNGRCGDDHREREHDRGGDQALRARLPTTFSTATPRRGAAPYPVLDLPGVPEVLNQRQGDGLDALEDAGDRDHPGTRSWRTRPGPRRSADALADLGNT